MDQDGFETVHGLGDRSRFETRTFGELAVNYDPGEENHDARELRELFANVIDLCRAIRDHNFDEYEERDAPQAADTAITQAQTACMWAVKAAYEQ